MIQALYYRETSYYVRSTSMILDTLRLKSPLRSVRLHVREYHVTRKSDQVPSMRDLCSPVIRERASLDECLYHNVNGSRESLVLVGV